MKERSLAIGSTLAAFIGIALLLRSAGSWWSRSGGSAGGDVRSSATLLSCSKWSSIGRGILFSLSKTEGCGGMCGRDMRTGEQDSPYGEALTLGSSICCCCPGVFPILRYNSESGLQHRRSTTPVRRKEDHSGKNCGCVQPGEFGFSRRAIEAWCKVARRCAEGRGRGDMYV
jgi:hypothetical protein